jgi:tetratricopeptide (TPR) repeat protein
MAGMYLELELTEEQMAAFDIAWLQGGLISENQVIGLASMHMTRGAPLQGAEIIVKGMEDGLVEDTDRNLQTIGQAYYQARELDQALVWMERAAAKSEGGDSYGRLAGVLISLGRFEEAYEAAMEALERGDLDQLTPDDVRLQAGAALFELYRYDEALRVFRAVRDERSRDTATQWIRYVESEASRERQLRASGIDIDAIRAQTRG